MNSGNKKSGAVKIRDLGNLIGNIPDILFWIKDLDGKFTAANDAFIRHLGHNSFDEIEGKTDFDLQPYHLSKEYVNNDQWVAETDSPIENKMELVKESDGTINWFTTTKVPLHNDEGIVWGTMGFTRKMKRTESQFIPVRGMTEIASYINDKYAESITVDRLAEMAQLSVVQFERNFKKVFHSTPVKYINMIRIKAACKLLAETSLDMKTIASQTGFNDQSYFTKQFFKALGILPKDYRASVL
jgi:PAS domain S-box-containing protein